MRLWWYYRICILFDVSSEEWLFPFYPLLKTIKANASSRIGHKHTTCTDRHKCRTGEESKFGERFSKESIQMTKMCDIKKYLVSLKFLPLFCNKFYSLLSFMQFY